METFLASFTWHHYITLATIGAFVACFYSLIKTEDELEEKAKINSEVLEEMNSLRKELHETRAELNEWMPKLTVREIKTQNVIRVNFDKVKNSRRVA